MKNVCSIAFTLMAVLSTLSGLSQSYSNIEFIENRGQWDKRVKYQGAMSAGAFFLESKGFRVLQNNPDDLKKMGDFFHGHSKNNNNNATSSAAKSPTKLPPLQPHILRSHAYDVQFLNAATPTITADKPIQGYNNYILGNDPSKWAGECKMYQAVNYTNMYPGVDVRYYSNDGRLKYDITVNPGADVSKIVMQYEGVDELKVVNDELVITTSAGTVKELAPYTYQIINGIKKEIPCRFVVLGKTVRFAVSNPAPNATLIIDPTLIFSTFTGSAVDNWGYTATYGPDGSFYSGGIVFGARFPVSTGAFQSAYAGGSNADGEGDGYDIGIMKFSPNGNTRLYATYIGGSNNEHPHSLVVDAQGQLVVAGRTSSSNYPTTATFGVGGGYDIVITKLNASGSALIGSIKIGGAGEDGVNIRGKYNGSSGTEVLRRNYGDDSRSEVILDNAGNIYLASSTRSVKGTIANNFPTTAGAFQSATGGGDQDGVLIKTTPNANSVLFSSFIGGAKLDAAFVLALHPFTGEIYVGGNTNSIDLPGDKTGVKYTTNQDGGAQTDGFISIVSPNGASLLKTTYMGTSGADMLYGIQFDKFGFPYIMGTTTGTWEVTSNVVYRDAGAKQYISKLSADLSRYEYSTTFGTANEVFPNISPVAFLIDRCENVYVSGWGGDLNSSGGYPNARTDGMRTTPDAIKRTTDGSDFYFFVLERNAVSQLYGSFFGQNSTGIGGEHVDGGTSRFDRNGVIYQAMCANCNSSVSFPTTPGVWASTNGAVGTGCNLAAVKIAFNLAGVAGSVQASIDGVPRDTSGCTPLTVDFTDTIALGTRYIWNFGDGTPSEETTTATNSHTFSAIGTYRVMLVSIDSSSCNVADSAFTTIRVRNDEALLGFNQRKVGACESTTYQFTNTSAPSEGKQFTNTSFVWYFGDNTPPVVSGPQPVNHTFAGIGTYTVRLVMVDTNFCNAPDSIVKTLRISANVIAGFSTPPSGCAPYNAVFENTSAGGEEFYWDFGDGTTSTQASPNHLYTAPGNYIIRLRVVDTTTCNQVDSTRFNITVSLKPEASFTFTPTPPQENVPVRFLNASLGATSYKWLFGDGDSLITTSQNPVDHIYNETRKYNACLIAINQFGCSDTTCLEVEAKIVPILDLPNAFTPNGDGINDRVFVKGFGIGKLNWQIYNRWGKMIFQSTSRFSGWDGRYNGALQPKEVYTYVLNVEFTDGTKYQKKGDITLL